MHVNAKKISFLGLLLAVCVLLLFFSSAMEMSTLFFLGAASFCVGIAVREYGVGMGAAFYTASVILGLLLIPNKLYLLTYSVMALYILLSELAWNLLCRKHKKIQPQNNMQDDMQNQRARMRIFWIIRYVIFNLCYLPILLLFPGLILTSTITAKVIIIAIVAGQIVLFLYEKAYCYFQVEVWNRFRKHLNS